MLQTVRYHNKTDMQQFVHCIKQQKGGPLLEHCSNGVRHPVKSFQKSHLSPKIHPVEDLILEWAVENLPNVTFKYCSMADCQSEEFLLRERFQKSCTIPGTRKLHASMLLLQAQEVHSAPRFMSPNSVEKVEDAYTH